MQSVREVLQRAEESVAELQSENECLVKEVKQKKLQVSSWAPHVLVFVEHLDNTGLTMRFISTLHMLKNVTCFLPNSAKREKVGWALFRKSLLICPQKERKMLFDPWSVALYP